MKKIILTILFIPFLFFSEAKDFKGAEIRTNESFLYGKFEIRMKSCEASGMLISFFTFYDDPDFAANWNEIDIEILGRYPNEVQFNAIVGKHQMHEHRQVLNFNPHSDFHTYAFEWTPEYIAWFVDGAEMHRQTGEHISRMNKKQKIMMNIWPSQFWEWTGPWNENTPLPLTALYDHIRYYEYTPAKNDKFTLSWEDNFDSLDLTRWSLATHSFDGNACDFEPDNAMVKNGKLALVLSKGEFGLKEEMSDDDEKESSPKESAITKATYVDNTTVRVTFSNPVNRINARRENFKIEGVEILKAKFNMDMTNVELITAPFELKEGTTLNFTPPESKEALPAQKISVTEK